MRLLPVCIIFSLSLLANGCMTPQQVRKMETDNAALQTQVDSLRFEVERLRGALAKSELPALQAKESVLRAGADTELRLNQFGEQIRVLDDRVDDLDTRVTNLPNKMRVAAERMASAPAATNPDPAGKEAESQSAVPAADLTANKGSSAAEKTSTADLSRLYDTAYQDLVRGQYDLSREGFMEFLRRYPQSSLADNAQYWIGESYYSQQQYARAAAEFTEVMEKYPNGDKVPAATLKRSFAMISMSKRAEARALLEQLVRKYPNTPEADLARARLKDL